MKAFSWSKEPPDAGLTLYKQTVLVVMEGNSYWRGYKFESQLWIGIFHINFF